VTQPELNIKNICTELIFVFAPMFKVYQRGRNEAVFTAENHNECSTKLSFLTQQDQADHQAKVGCGGQMTNSDLEFQDFKFRERIRIDESSHRIRFVAYHSSYILLII
jgi:hypothetical protein